MGVGVSSMQSHDDSYRFDLSTMPALPTRLRRLRYRAGLRALVRDIHLGVTDFVQPVFVKSGEGIKQPIASMPGQYQYSVDHLEPFIARIAASGVPAVLLFGIPAFKDQHGSAAWDDDQGIIQMATRWIKAHYPALTVMADLCFCEYTDHGHCGVVKSTYSDALDVHNDLTLPLLSKQALSLAQAGVDVLAPSGMMDGAVGAIRTALDQAHFSHVPILSYAVKYASAFYGPFREAAQGAPQFGDRSTYQMDPSCSLQALREVEMDRGEGADIFMIKPAHAYLDVLRQIRVAYPQLPLAAYHVSGEYAMLKAAVARGWIEEKKAVLEVLVAMKRAGANFIVTYYALQAAQFLADAP